VKKYYYRREAKTNGSFNEGCMQETVAAVPVFILGLAPGSKSECE
jgi:hypothetical protein